MPIVHGHMNLDLLVGGKSAPLTMDLATLLMLRQSGKSFDLVTVGSTGCPLAGRGSAMVSWQLVASASDQCPQHMATQCLSSGSSSELATGLKSGLRP